MIQTRRNYQLAGPDKLRIKIAAVDLGQRAWITLENYLKSCLNTMNFNLIIQSKSVATQSLKQLAKLSGASEIQAITQQAFRLPGANPASQAEVERLCEQSGLDYAFVPDTRKMSDFGLVVMDMDSTLITIECIDEIADMIGVKPEVAHITEAAMRGEIDFAESLTRRVALLKGLDESALQRVYDERLRLSPGAEKMLAALQSHGIKTLLVSGGFTFFTERLKLRLGLDAAIANTLEIVDGKLTGRVLGTILDAEGKATQLRIACVTNWDLQRTR